MQQWKSVDEILDFAIGQENRRPNSTLAWPAGWTGRG